MKQVDDEELWGQVSRIRDRFTMYLSPKYHIEQVILQHGDWEPHLDLIFDFLVRPGMTCVDVGANSGYHSLSLAWLVKESGKVVSFEPLSVNFDRLKDNIDLNPELAARIELHKLGVAHERGSFFAATAGPAGNGVMRFDEDSAKAYGKSEVCHAVTLDEFLSGRQVDFIKIDVEGLELEVLQGAEDLLRKSRPILCYESLVEVFDKQKLKAIEELLLACDYRLVALFGDLPKLVPVSFPFYGPDTIAFPAEKCIDYAEVLYFASQYSLTDPENAQAVATLTAVTFGKSEVFFSLHYHGQHYRARGVFEEQGAPNFELEFQPTSSGPVTMVIACENREMTRGQVVVRVDSKEQVFALGGPKGCMNADLIQHASLGDLLRKTVR